MGSKLLATALLLGLVSFADGCTVGQWTVLEEKKGPRIHHMPGVKEVYLRKLNFRAGWKAEWKGNFPKWQEYYAEKLRYDSGLKVHSVGQDAEITKGIDIRTDVFYLTKSNNLYWCYTTVTIMNRTTNELVWKGRLETAGMVLGDAKNAPNFEFDLQVKLCFVHVLRAIMDVLENGRPPVSKRTPKVLAGLLCRPAAMENEAKVYSVEGNDRFVGIAHLMSQGKKADPKDYAYVIERYSQADPLYVKASASMVTAIRNARSVIKVELINTLAAMEQDHAKMLVRLGLCLDPRFNPKGSWPASTQALRRSLEVLDRTDPDDLTIKGKEQFWGEVGKATFHLAVASIQGDRAKLDPKSRAMFTKAVGLLEKGGPAYAKTLALAQGYLN